ncbi:MAG: hypothetical protein ACREX4_14860 [Gammaproteobacteria bacterium]
MMKNVAGFIGAFLLLVNATAWAHGGVSIEEDKCVLKIGNYLAHFADYQPESRGSEEFCEDIPSTGHAIIVMDFVDPQLRKWTPRYASFKRILGARPKPTRWERKRRRSPTFDHKNTKAALSDSTIGLQSPAILSAS